MPKVPDGELSLAELKRLVKQYNLQMSIKVTGLKRDDLIKQLKDMGYTIDHANKKLNLTNKSKAMKRKPINVKMPPAPAKKTDAEKSESKAKQRERVIKYIVQNKDVLKDDRIKGLKQSVSTQTGNDAPPPTDDKALLQQYKKISVNDMNKILDKLPNTSRAGGGTKLQKIKKIIKFKGEADLKKLL